MEPPVGSAGFWPGYFAGLITPFVISALILLILVWTDSRKKPRWLTDVASDEDGIVPVCSKCCQAIRVNHKQHESECWGREHEHQ